MRQNKKMNINICKLQNAYYKWLLLGVFPNEQGVLPGCQFQDANNIISIIIVVVATTIY